MDMPVKTGASFTLASDVGLDEERSRLAAHGCEVVEADRSIGTTDGSRCFVQGSRGEFSPARRSYVENRMGWISDRTICYLASGKPCVVEDTGPVGYLPAGRGGLHRFKGPEDAAR